MASDSEPERIRGKTDAVLLDHHLTWMGLTPGESFIDFGCASGEVVRAARMRSGTGAVMGVDADERMLAYAAAESARLGLNIDYTHAVLSGRGSSGLADALYDHAWTRFFLEYIKEPLPVIREMARVVRPGGKVTLIDIDGFGVWHHPMSKVFEARLDEVMAGLSTTGFDPYVGSKLAGYAAAAGLVDIRVQVEPYHWIVGAPDETAAAAWTARVNGIRETFVTRVAPEKTHLVDFFDEYLEFVLSDQTMTWSLSYLVQGTRSA